ncbi:MAG: M23 family metallopeptidase [Candidatus Ancillula sp.]|nr:M23 family metallopeptidase [Candidatus Ancillula sp.]
MKAQIEAEEAKLSADLAAIAKSPGSDGFDGSGGVLSYPVGNHGITAGFHDPAYYAAFGWVHNGVDFGYVGCGTPIHASADGRVDLVSYNSARGNYIVVNHGSNGGSNLMTVYQHMPYGGVYASQGAWVSRGQTIGIVGGGANGTGASTGCHLHFEVWVNGSPVNPLGYF